MLNICIHSGSYHNIFISIRLQSSSFLWVHTCLSVWIKIHLFAIQYPLPVTWKHFFKIFHEFWSRCFRIHGKSWRSVLLVLHAEWFVEQLQALPFTFQVVESLSATICETFLPDLVPGLLNGYDNSESSVRKACVFGLVALYVLVGDGVRPYLKDLSSSKVRTRQEWKKIIFWWNVHVWTHNMILMERVNKMYIKLTLCR